MRQREKEREERVAAGIRVKLSDRAIMIDKLLREKGPMGCKQIGVHYNLGRSSIQHVVQPRVGTMFKVVQLATNGPYGTEALYDVIDSPRPAVEPVEEEQVVSVNEAAAALHNIMHAMVSA